MKIYYFNDQTTQAMIYTGSFAGPSRKLTPASGELFEFNAPEGSHPFVKVWENNTVLLSFVDKKATFEPEIA